MGTKGINILFEIPFQGNSQAVNNFIHYSN